MLAIKDLRLLWFSFQRRGALRVTFNCHSSDDPQQKIVYLFVDATCEIFS